MPLFLSQIISGNFLFSISFFSLSLAGEACIPPQGVNDRLLAPLECGQFPGSISLYYFPEADDFK
jgi:hypothetical protein